MQKKINILVVGGTGFIGEYLINLLRNNKNCKIFVIHKGKINPKEKDPDVSYHEIDLSRVNPFIKYKPPIFDIIVILTRPEKNIIKNICKIYNKKLNKIIFASTLLLYPDSSKKQNEKISPHPITLYEIDKFREEKQLIKFVKNKKIDLCIPRFGNMYGDIKNTGIISKIFKSLIYKKSLEIKGDGSQKRDYIFVEDAANILNKLIFLKQKNQMEIFNVCTKKSYSILDIIRNIEKIFKERIQYTLTKGVQEKGSVFGNNAKVLHLTQYSIQYNIISGLKKTYLNFKSKS